MLTERTNPGSGPIRFFVNEELVERVLRIKRTRMLDAGFKVRGKA